MAQAADIHEFLKLSEEHPVIDVRTPAEFAQGHIIGALNIPLFTNEERAVIGTLYKQKGKQPAVLKALELVGPKLHAYIEQALAIRKEGLLLVHCWRGGMRSSSMAWFLETYGFKCITLKGGYKMYRRHVLASFEKKKKLIVLGGKTGTGKTIILHELEKAGEQVIDLEKLAHHKGSSFGSLGEEPQHSQEQFENELSFYFSKIDPDKRCWVENESRKIGVNVLPESLWNAMQSARVISVELPVSERIAYLVKEYGKFPSEQLIAAVQRIAKRLGGQHAKRAVEALEQGDHKTAFEVCLVYYDKTYSYGAEQRPKENIIACPFEKMDPAYIADTVRKITWSEPADLPLN